MYKQEIFLALSNQKWKYQKQNHNVPSHFYDRVILTDSWIMTQMYMMLQMLRQTFTKGIERNLKLSERPGLTLLLWMMSTGLRSMPPVTG